LKTEGKHFFWTNQPSNRGYMMHEFRETGIFCFKTANNQIGTIIVEPKINIHSFPIFGDQLSKYTNREKSKRLFEYFSFKNEYK
jgi:hypothetical protein